MTATTLIRALQQQRQAAEQGFDWPDVDGAWRKLHEELQELQQADNPNARAHELGDVLYSVVNIARFLEIDPDAALQQACQRFEERFAYVEARIRQSELPPDLEQMEDWWQQAKQSGQE